MKKAATVTLSVPQELGIGFIAGVLSRLVTTPLSVVTVRLQVDDDDDDVTGSVQSDTGIVGTVHKIYDEDGIPGFWKGNASALAVFLL